MHNLHVQPKVMDSDQMARLAADKITNAQLVEMDKVLLSFSEYYKLKYGKFNTSKLALKDNDGNIELSYDGKIFSTIKAEFEPTPFGLVAVINYSKITASN